MDFGSQTTQLIGRRVRELGIYSEIIPYHSYPYGQERRGEHNRCYSFGQPSERVRQGCLPHPAGPYSGPCADCSAYAMAPSSWPFAWAGRVSRHPRVNMAARASDSRHPARLWLESLRCTGVDEPWRHHHRSSRRLPCHCIHRRCPLCRLCRRRYAVWGVQFHPEVFHSECGKQILENFAVGICGAACDWSTESFIDSTVAELRRTLGDDKVVLGLSGGVDMHRGCRTACPRHRRRLNCIFVDHGMLRLGEFRRCNDRIPPSRP